MTSEETVFVHLAGTSNVMKGRSEEIVNRYREFVGTLKDSHKRSVVCELIPLHDTNFLILRRMFGINARVTLNEIV